MNLTQHLKSYPSLLGERYDMKTCWEATDNFFDCLDREGLINVNVKRCPREFGLWKDSCAAAVRKDQMLIRRQIKEERQLYSQDQLDEYNRRKNSILPQ